MPKITFNELRQFAKTKAKKVTKVPVKLVLADTFSGKKDVVARSYKIEFVPDDPKKPPVVVSREIALKRAYYNMHRTKPAELKNAVIHEIAHSVSEKHDAKFRKAAKELGADKNHQKAVWE